jgi:protein gp37
MRDSMIGWTHNAWNPWRGCTGENCWLRATGNCYINLPIKRLRGDPERPSLASLNVWQDPLVWETEAAKAGHAKRVFCGSLMDFNDRNANMLWRQKAWSIIADTRHLAYMLLSKCPERYADNLPNDWGSGYQNVWVGASVLHSEDFRRNTKYLTSIPAARKFLSIEPMLGPIPDPDFTGIDLVLVGGISGINWKDNRTDMSWVINLYQATRTWNQTRTERPVHFFFKQDSHRFTERGINALGKALGRPEPDQVVREMPAAPFGLPWAPMEQKGRA